MFCAKPWCCGDLIPDMLMLEVELTFSQSRRNSRELGCSLLPRCGFSMHAALEVAEVVHISAMDVKHLELAVWAGRPARTGFLLSEPKIHRTAS